MYSPLSVWHVQEFVVSVYGVEGYSSVMQWMVVEVVHAGHDWVIWEFYWRARHRHHHTVHRTMAGHDVGHSLSQSWFA